MIIAYYALHYGSDYLGYSIKSIYDFVDKIYILYTDKPSHGHGTLLQNPDNREKLKAAANLFGDPKGKINWVEGHWHQEGEQRNAITSIANSVNADTIVVVDSDEIWKPETLQNGIRDASNGNERNYCIRMLTFWRSFSWVCHDEMMPTRIINHKKPGGNNYLGDRVLHFGYARSIADTNYKMSIHGHKAEWRGDWFNNKFKSWPGSGNNDLHPTCVNTWNCVPYDKLLLPEHLRSHPYYNLSVIG